MLILLVSSQYFGEIVVNVVSTPALPKGRRDRCAFGAVYGGGIAPPPTQPPIIEMIHFLHVERRLWTDLFCSPI
jgi:hypothetical protein